MIILDNINKAFGDKVLFNNYNLRIDNGEFIIFSGISGCGKTTLLNMIGSLEKPDSGKIIVDDIDITKSKNQLHYFREKVGFLFQNFALMEEKTVFNNLKIIKKGNKTSINLEDALERVGLKSAINKKVYTLSGGEQQRVALARLMLKKCDIILADEPTGSLDKKNAQEVMSILSDMNKEGKTVIIVTHDENIKKMGKRVVEL